RKSVVGHTSSDQFIACVHLALCDPCPAFSLRCISVYSNLLELVSLSTNHACPPLTANSPRHTATAAAHSELQPLAVHRREGPRHRRVFSLAGSLPSLHPQPLPLELRSLDVPSTMAGSSNPLLRRRRRRPSPPPPPSFSLFYPTCAAHVLPDVRPICSPFPRSPNLHKVRKESTFIWIHSLWTFPAGKKVLMKILFVFQEE
ncbi:unnamed protein product, partial [Urochloa humidicola]